MKIIKIKTQSIAQLSYLIVDGDKAAVIDPRRDAKIYYDKAKKLGATIDYIFESHRNEDFVTGSRELKRYTKAEIYHGSGLDFQFGMYAKEGQIFKLKNAYIKCLETPGHTPESISLALYPDLETESAVAVFSGDALFVDDVGRVDFFPNKRREYAEKLYDSIHYKILPLGDGVVLYPAHGAGSVCGGGIADREVSTLGYEKKHNPMLQLSKEEFIDKKTNEKHQKPPYFKQMEKINLEGSDKALNGYEKLDFKKVADLKKLFTSSQVIDTRAVESFAGCHIPGTLSMPLDMIGAYAGYFLNYVDPIILVSESFSDAKKVEKELVNLGYDNALFVLKGGLSEWETSGEPLGSVEIVDVRQIVEAKIGKNSIFLDVRKPDEWASGILNNAKTIFLGDLVKNMNAIDRDKEVIVYCGSGKRATIAASILLKNKFKKIKVFMGSMKAYKAYNK